MMTRRVQRNTAGRSIHGIDRMVRNVETGRFERSLSALTAAGALVTAAEIFFEHDSASFGNKMMWVPVALGPVTPVDIGLRYQVLDKGQADLSILFTSDAQLANTDKYTLLTDDKHVLTPGYPMWVTSKKVVQQAGPDYEKTINEVSKPLDLKTIRELNARVDIDKKPPAEVASEYLKEQGLVK